MSARVLVLGATGFVGARVAARLLADGAQVRSLTRRGQAARGVEALTGDATDVDAVARALVDCEAVCVCVPWEQEPRVVEAVVAAAARLGRRDLHVLYVSGITVVTQNAGAAMVDAKLAAEQALVASGLPCTVLKPSWFMDALGLFVRDGRATMFGRQPVPFRLVALDDFALVVSRCARERSSGQRTLVVEGPTPLRLDEALVRYCAVAHPTLKPSVLPPWVGRVLAFFARSAELRAFVDMMAYFSTVAHVAQDEQVSTATTFEQWLVRDEVSAVSQRAVAGEVAT
jgi:uncharacterized protein YbjT (DUF2867 family)